MQHGSENGSTWRGTPGAFRATFVRGTAILVSVLYFCTACFTYTPVHTAPSIGATVALEVNDEGRVALNRPLGPGVLRVQGTLAAVEGDEYVIDASAVTPIRGQELPVSGVRVRLSQRYVTRVDERRFSRRRTALVIGTAVLVVAAFFITKGFTSGHTPPEDTGGGPGPNQ